MGISKTLIRINLRERPDLAGAIRKANDYLTAHYPAEQFATLFYAAYDPATGELEYVSCGHPAALMRRADGRIEALPAGGLPVGMFEDLRVTSRPARLDAGDLLLIYSDGVTEAADGSASGVRRGRGSARRWRLRRAGRGRRWRRSSRRRGPSLAARRSRTTSPVWRWQRSR